QKPKFNIFEILIPAVIAAAVVGAAAGLYLRRKGKISRAKRARRVEAIKGLKGGRISKKPKAKVKAKTGRAKARAKKARNK
ncbi:MAG: hypothetical protein QXK65_02820, partial [Candidatus Micrarchaeaceae archaeon]